MLTKILLGAFIFCIVAFTITGCVLLFIKSIAKSKRLMSLTLQKVLIKKCNRQPNKLMVFKQTDGSLLEVKYLPKVVK